MGRYRISKSMTDADIRDYADYYGAESAYNILTLCGADRFKGNYDKMLAELQVEMCRELLEGWFGTKRANMVGDTDIREVIAIATDEYGFDKDKFLHTAYARFCRLGA